MRRRSSLWCRRGVMVHGWSVSLGIAIVLLFVVRCRRPLSSLSLNQWRSNSCILHHNCSSLHSSLETNSVDQQWIASREKKSTSQAQTRTVVVGRCTACRAVTSKLGKSHVILVHFQVTEALTARIIRVVGVIRNLNLVECRSRIWSSTGGRRSLVTCTKVFTWRRRRDIWRRRSRHRHHDHRQQQLDKRQHFVVKTALLLIFFVFLLVYFQPKRCDTRKCLEGKARCSFLVLSLPRLFGWSHVCISVAGVADCNTCSCCF